MAVPIEVMSTLGVFGPLSTRIAPAFEARSGQRISVRYDPTGILMSAIKGGARADVVIAIGGSIDELAGQGIIDPSSAVAIARSGVGLAVAPGAPHPDVSTPDRFVATLRAARSIAFSRAGASGLTFARLIERLGIADEIRAKSVIIPDGFTAERLVSGECDLAVQQISELRAVPGVEIIGPIPAPYQETISFVAALFIGSPRPGPARELIAALIEPDAAAAFADAGLEPPAS